VVINSEIRKYEKQKTEKYEKQKIETSKKLVKSCNKK